MEKEKLIKLVIDAQSGSDTAISEIYNAFHNDIYYIALRETKNPDTALDITQEAFIEIIQTINKLQEPAAFITWIKAIAYHQCTRYYKKKDVKHEIIIDEQEDMPSVFEMLEEENEEFIPDKALDNEDFKETIRNFIGDLPEAQRTAIMMKYFDEMSVKQIAEIQGVSENTVLSRLNYGRKAIKSSVEDYEKKHNIKLHAIPFFPLFKWLFDGVSESMSIEAATATAESIAAATGTTITVSATSVSVVAATATTVGVTAAKVGLGAKIASLPLVAKIISGVVAIFVAVSTPLLIENITADKSISSGILNASTAAISSQLISSGPAIIEENVNSTETSSTIQSSTVETPTVKPLCSHKDYTPYDNRTYSEDGGISVTYLISSDWSKLEPGVENHYELSSGCTQGGSVIYKCPQCLEPVLYKKLEPLGHDFSGEEVVLEYPWVNKEGSYGKRCQRENCNEKLHTTIIPERAGDYSTIDPCFTVSTAGYFEHYIINNPEITIYDERTWGSVPTITFDMQTYVGKIEFTGKDGTLITYDFIVDVEFLTQHEGWSYSGSIKEDGQYHAGYYAPLGFNGSSTGS